MIFKTKTQQQKIIKLFLKAQKQCKFIVKTVKNPQVTHFQKSLVLISKNKIKEKSKCTVCLI